MDFAALMRCSLEHPADRRHQPGVFIGGDETDTVKPAGAEPAAELGPERFGFGVPDRTAQHFSAAVGGDPGGDHHRFGDHLMILPAVDVGGVDKHVGELDVIEAAVAEGVDGLVKTRTDP